MTTNTIEVSQDYKLHVTVAPVERPAFHYHLKIESQLLSAKDPQGLQTKFSATLPQRHLYELAATIIEGCKQ